MNLVVPLHIASKKYLNNLKLKQKILFLLDERTRFNHQHFIYVPFIFNHSMNMLAPVAPSSMLTDFVNLLILSQVFDFYTVIMNNYFENDHFISNIFSKLVLIITV